jgi:hypothetical protein
MEIVLGKIWDGYGMISYISLSLHYHLVKYLRQCLKKFPFAVYIIFGFVIDYSRMPNLEPVILSWPEVVVPLFV